MSWRVGIGRVTPVSDTMYMGMDGDISTFFESVVSQAEQGKWAVYLGFSLWRMFIVRVLDEFESSRVDNDSKLLKWATAFESFEKKYMIREDDGGTMYIVNRDDGTEASFGVTGYLRSYWLPSGKVTGRWVGLWIRGNYTEYLFMVEQWGILALLSRALLSQVPVRGSPQLAKHAVMSLTGWRVALLKVYFSRMSRFVELTRIYLALGRARRFWLVLGPALARRE